MSKFYFKWNGEALFRKNTKEKVNKTKKGKVKR